MEQTIINTNKEYVHKLTVGVIVPVYKAEKYILECIDSVIEQTYTNWIMILVDDGSPDHSGVICDEYAKKDKRIRVIHKKNGGLVSAWKRGLSELPKNIGYVTFVDSDDWITKEFLEELVKKQQENYADVVVSRLCGIFPDGKTSLDHFFVKVKYYDRLSMEKELFPVLLYGGNFHKRGLPCSRCGKLIKKELMVHNLKYISEQTTYGEDLNITFPMFLDASSVDIVENIQCLYMVRKNPDSMTRAYDGKMRSSINHVYNSLFEIAYDKGKEAVLKKQILADYLAASVQYYKNELQNPQGVSEGEKQIASYVKDNNRLKESIKEIEWKHYKKLNVIIIKSLRNYNWLNRFMVTGILSLLKKYRLNKLKRMS